MMRIRLALPVLLATAPLAQQQAHEAPLVFERGELSSPAGENSGMPYLHLGADGELYLAWLEELAGPKAALNFSKLTPAGWSPARMIARGEDWFNNWADTPSIAALPDGTLIAHWLQRMGSATYAYGVRISLSQDGGAHWGAAQWLHDDRRAVEHGFVSIAALDSERFGAVWLDGRVTELPAAAGSGFEKGPQQLYFRTIERNGRLGDESCLDDAVCDCCPTSLAALGDARLALAYRDRTPGELRDVRLMDYAAGSWSASKGLSEPAWKIPGCPVNGPSLAANPRVLGLAWYSAAEDESRVLARLGASTLEDASCVQIDEGAPEGRAAALLFDDQTLVVAWLEHGSGGATWMLRSLGSTGILGEPFVVARVPGNRASGYARLQKLGDQLIFAWTDPGQQRVLTCSLRATRRAE